MMTTTMQVTPEPVVDIPLSTLLDGDGQFRTVQVREKINQSAVDAYATVMRDGRAGQFPPIIVYEVTDRGGSRYLAAGLHRSTAAQQAKLTSLRGYLRRGTWHEALEAAIKTNATHGHRPTFEDVCQTLLQMQGDDDYRDLSNVRKAEIIGVSEGTVRNAKRHLVATSQLTKSDTVTVTRKDGTTYELPSTERPKARADEDDDALTERPKARATVVMTALGAVMDKAKGIVQTMREAGLENAPGEAIAAYRVRFVAGDSLQEDEAQTARTVAHFLLTLADATGEAARGDPRAADIPVAASNEKDDKAA